MPTPEKKPTAKKPVAKKAPAKKAPAPKKAAPAVGQVKAPKPKPKVKAPATMPEKFEGDPLKMPEKQARESLKTLHGLQAVVDRMADRRDAAKEKFDAAKKQHADAEKDLHEEIHAQKSGPGPLFK